MSITQTVGSSSAHASPGTLPLLAVKTLSGGACSRGVHPSASRGSGRRYHAQTRKRWRIQVVTRVGSVLEGLATISDTLSLRVSVTFKLLQVSQEYAATYAAPTTSGGEVPALYCIFRSHYFVILSCEILVEGDHVHVCDG